MDTILASMRDMPPMEAGFSGTEARDVESVRRETWGYLALKRGKEYRGYIVFACSAYGSEVMVIDSGFGTLDDSPWLFDALYEYASNNSTEDGTAYRFDGFIRNYEFVGNVKMIDAG